MTTPRFNSLYSSRTWIDQQFEPATIFIKNKRIHAIEKGKIEHPDFLLEDAGDAIVMPGLTDIHVHINEPGNTIWEGFEPATKAAAAGGITTVVDMPLNSVPVTTTVESLKDKMAAAKGNIHVDCGFWGGVVPGNSGHLEALLESGILGVKAFLTASGLEEFPHVSEADLRKAMPQIARSGLPLLVHCELSAPHQGLEDFKQSPDRYPAFLASRPKSWENSAIDMMIGLCREYRCRTHIVHLSSAEALPAILKAKEEGLPLTVETCPHYLFFNAEEIPDADPRYKCAPPVRERENNEQLWEALESGIIDMVASDHSPAPPELKRIDEGDLYHGWGGISGLQFMLPVVWTAARSRNHTLKKILHWLVEAPADFIGFSDKKGKIEVGRQADLVVWDPDEPFEVKAENIFHRHRVTPYLGRQLYGKVKQTYVGGDKVFEDGHMILLNRGSLITERRKRSSERNE